MSDSRLNSPLLKASDVAQILKISRSLAYKLMQTGQIPTVYFNRSARVKAEDLEAFIEQHKR